MNLAMRKRLNTGVAVVALTLACLPAAQAQSAPQDRRQDLLSKRVTLNVESADLRLALKLLFDAAGANYTLDQAVQGTVTVSLRDIPFRTALESLLRSTQSQNPLTYRVEDGVYVITPQLREPTVAVESTVEAPAVPAKRTIKIPVNWVDGALLAQALGGSVIDLGSGQRMGLMGNGGSFGGGFGTSGFGGMGLGDLNGGRSMGSGFGSFGNGSFGSGFNNAGNGTNPGSGMGSGSSGNRR